MWQMISQQISDSGAKSAEAFRGAAKTHQEMGLKPGTFKPSSATADINSTSAGTIDSTPVATEAPENTAKDLEVETKNEAPVTPELEIGKDNPFFNQKDDAPPAQEAANTGTMEVTDNPFKNGIMGGV